MAIVLYRVDERLIHGQVVVGWGTELHPDRIVVVDDDLSASAWEQELYCLGLPDGLEAEFDTVDAARDSLPRWRASANRIIVLTRDIATMRRLAEGGRLRGEEINLGGIHYANGRSAVLPYLYLSNDERTELEELSSQGAILSARDVPSARKVDLSHLMKDHRKE